MKDYYYFLGITPNATAEEIKKAYRKLSLKYHPDKNGNDVFFADRFREIQEAYDILINEDSRAIYNQRFARFQKNNKSLLPPKIGSFNADKIRVQKGDEITLHWLTYDADVVKILPFGLEKLQGERKFRITEFSSDGTFHILLHATNSYLNKTVVKGITIREVDVNIQYSEKKQNSPYVNITKKEKKEVDNYVKRLIIFVFFILLFIAIYLSEK